MTTQQSPAYTKAWLKVSYKQQTYIPVVILQRTKQLRTLVVDQGHPLDRKLAYYVQDNNLMPREQQSMNKNLLDYQNINFPELKKQLSGSTQLISNNNDGNTKKYLPVGENLMIDIQRTENNRNKMVDEELQEFYNSKLQELLSNKKQNEKLVFIVSKQNQNPHYYINPLLQLISKSQNYWPHRSKIQKLSVILKKILFNASIELKLGFIQHKSNLKQSRKVMYVHLRPYLSILPSQGLAIPASVLGIGNTEKFVKMYRGPSIISPQTSPSQIQSLVDAFLSLGVEVKKIHTIMKLLSAIINLNRLKIQEETDGSQDSKYVSYHLASEQPEQSNDPIQNINQLLKLDPQRLQNLFIHGQIDQGGKSLKQRQAMAYLQCLGTKKNVATYRLNVFKFILYQIFLIQVCQTINEKLMTQDFVNQTLVENTQFKNKNLIVFSYGVCQKAKKLANMSQDLKHILFWNNGRQKLQKKIINMMKPTILSSIVGQIPLQKNIEKKPINKQQKPQTKQLNQSEFISKRKKAGMQQKKTLYIKNIKQSISYQQSINQFKKLVQNPEKTNLEYCQVILLEKQKALIKLYQEMSSYRIVSQICMHLFDKIVKKQIIQQIPYSIYEYVWPNFEQYSKAQSNVLISWTKDQGVITNNKLILQDQNFLWKINDAVHKKRLKIQEGEKDKQNIQIRLAQFANRYLYNKVCVQNVHRVYPKKIQKFGKKVKKNERIANASPYSDHLITAEQLQKKLQTYISKQNPPKLQLIKPSGNFRKNQQKAIKINSKKYFQELQKQVQDQNQKARKIQRQFNTYKDRMKTNQILFKIWRQRNLQKLLNRLKKTMTKREAYNNIKRLVDDGQQRQQQMRRNRLKQLREQDLYRQRQRLRRQRQAKRVAALAKQQKLKKQEQQKKRIEQQKQKKLEQQKQLQRQRQEKKREEQQKQQEQQKNREHDQQASPSQVPQKTPAKKPHRPYQNPKNTDSTRSDGSNVDQEPEESQQIDKPQQLREREREKNKKYVNEQVEPIQEQNQQDDAPFILNQPKQNKAKPSVKKQNYPEQQQQPAQFVLTQKKQQKSANTNTNTASKPKPNTTTNTNPVRQTGSNPQQPTTKQQKNSQPQQTAKKTSTQQAVNQPTNNDPNDDLNDDPNDDAYDDAYDDIQPTDEAADQPKQATNTGQSPTKTAQTSTSANPSNTTSQPKSQPKSTTKEPASEPANQNNKQPTTSTNTTPSTNAATKQPSSQLPKQSNTQTGTQSTTQPTDKPQTANKTATTQPNTTQASQPPKQNSQPATKQPLGSGPINQSAKTTQPTQQTTQQPTTQQPTATQQPMQSSQSQPGQTAPKQDNYKITIQPSKQTNPVATSAPTSPATNNPPQQLKNKTQHTPKHTNLQQLTNQQLQSIKDSPNCTLEEWDKNSKIKIGPSQNPKKEIYTKYATMTQRINAKAFEPAKLVPTPEILKLLTTGGDLMAVAKEIVKCNDSMQQLTQILTNQTSQLSSPILKTYPQQKHPTVYKQAFNSILKLGLQKNSSKKTHQLLNFFTIPLSKSYHQQIQTIKVLSNSGDYTLLPPDHSSPHNAMKDEIFLYFIKQINFDVVKYKKNYQGYLYGLVMFTRYYYPSPKMLLPYTNYIYQLYKSAQQKNTDQNQINLLESIFQNLLFFVQAAQIVKGNKISAFVKQTYQTIRQKSVLQSYGYLQIKRGPIRENQIVPYQEGKKPEPPVVSIWLINNQSYYFPIRNQNALTLKRLLLEEIGYLNRQPCFQLYFFQPDYSYTLINEKQKAINFLILMQIYKQQKRRRPIYLRINHYFPFILKDLNTTRMMYMNMVSDQLTFPWTAQTYQFIVAQSMAYEDYQDVRIGNYLQFSGQSTSKEPNMVPVTEKYKIISVDAAKKCCQLQYLKYLKSLGFFLSKCYGVEDDPNYVIMVKPYEFSIYKHTKLFSSIGFKRIKNAYMQGRNIVLEVYYKNTLEKGKQQTNQRLRKHTILQCKKVKQLFQTILFHLQNRLHP